MQDDVGVGLTATLHEVGVGALAAGVDAWYGILPVVAVGVEAQTFAVDNGADPHYCEDCLSEGTMVSGFAEARSPRLGPLALFARGGVGAAFVERIQSTPSGNQGSTGPVFSLTLGPEVSWWHVFLRVRGNATSLGNDSFVGYGAELGSWF